MTAQDKLPEPDLSGQTLDRYRLLRRLGVGGMGAVYEAEHTRLRKRFAVKLLRYELARNEISRKRFLREARAASAVTHPHVVAISDFGETDDGQVFFVMELLQGRDLHDVLEAERVLPWPRTREILLQVTSALQAAHLQDIIHRDIKPSNVFLADIPGKSDEDVVKVLDFGIAKLSGTIGEATAKLTSTDEIFGTVAYMAPEMAMGVNDDRRSDIYAVGVMMYRMLTGELPFTQGNAFQILSQHINAPIPSAREKVPSIPETVEAIILKAMAKEPGDRFPSMDELGRALRRGMVEATESLVGIDVALLTAQPRGPLDAAPTSSDIDKTTPLPARGTGVPTPQPTVVSTPIHTERPDSGTLRPDGLDPRLTDSATVPRLEPGLTDSATVPRLEPGLTDSAAVPRLEPGLTDSAAVPRVEEQHTVVSTPIAVGPSDSSGALEQPMPAVGSQPVATEPSGSLAVPAMTVAAPFVSSSSRPVEPAVAPTTGPTGPVSTSAAFAEWSEPEEEPRRSPLRLVLPAVGAIVVLGAVAFFTMKGPTDEPAPAQAKVAASPPQEAKPQPTPSPEPEVTPPVEDPERTAEDPEPEPTPPDPSADEAEPPTPREPAPAEPTKPSRSKPAKSSPTKSSPTRPAPTKPPPRPPAKPKTDQEVVATLKAKIAAKCKGQGVKVRVEGVIAASGKVENLYITPADGLGDCAKLVKAAKFDPDPGVRPMPRFSVQL